MKPTLDDAVHLVLGDSAGGTLRQLDLGPVLVLRDLLTVGACDIDPAQHRKLRMAQWKIGTEEARAGLIGFEDFARALPDDDRPIVLWMTETWSDQCFTWSTLERLGRLGVEAGRIWLVPVSERFSVGAFTAEQLYAAFGNIGRVSQAMLADAAALWQMYCAQSPIAFDHARRTGSKAFPALPLVAEGHGAWFPWRAGDGLKLSYVDQLFFDCIDDEWRKAPDMLRKPRGEEMARRLFAWFGDLAMFDRVTQWATLGVLERRVLDETLSLGFEVRLTDRGRRLRDEGARDVEELLPASVGGARVNDPHTPWVREGDAQSWRLAPL